MIVAIPSRGRPERLRRLLDSAVATETQCRLYVRLDNDDPALDDYVGLITEGRLCGRVGPRIGFARSLQECLADHPKEDCYGFMGDDTCLHVRNWDRILRTAAGRWNVAYPDDGLKGESQATHPFIGGDFLRAIGFWGLPGLTHLFTDTVWDFLGRRYGNLVYRPDVVVEHLHWSASKCARDASYAKPTAAKDQACFLHWIASYQIDPILRGKIAASADATLA